MKKLLAVLALALFVGGISAPAIASHSNDLMLVSLRGDEPTKDEPKAEKKESSEQKAETTEATTETATKATVEVKTEKKGHDCAAVETVEAKVKVEKTETVAETKTHDCSK